MKNDTVDTDAYLGRLPDWQKNHLQTFRSVIHSVIPTVIEEIKWNVPVFIHDGKVLFAMSAFKQHTKYNFILNGALLEDKDGLFNNGFDSKKSRGLDRKENDTIDEAALKRLVEDAVRHAES